MESAKTTRVTISLPSDLYAQIKLIAKKEDRTISAQISKYLKNQIEKNEGL
jgi:hypothetical protein